jgi:hypothetical protein
VQNTPWLARDRGYTGEYLAIKPQAEGEILGNLQPDWINSGAVATFVEVRDDGSGRNIAGSTRRVRTAAQPAR